MAGYSKLYCVGGLGGFQGADGINPIQFQIWVGDADRQWLEVHYFHASIKPLGKMRSFVPEGPNLPDNLLDACLLFYPKHFRGCPSLDVVTEQLQDFEELDFHLARDKIPAEWPALREEARAAFRELNIFEADLVPVKKN